MTSSTALPPLDDQDGGDVQPCEETTDGQDGSGVQPSDENGKDDDGNEKDEDGGSQPSQQQQVRSQLVLDLKRKALAAKKSENLKEALSLLKQAKEVENCSDEEITSHPLYQQFMKNDEEEEEVSDILQEVSTTTHAVTFTDEEMMNEEMMTEFALGGMEVPSNEAYQSGILKYKQAALQHKQQGDIPKATSNLKNAKQLQKVLASLQNIRDGVGLRVHDDIDGWMETLSDEDRSLLGELLTTSQNDDGLLSIDRPTKLELKDLELMDDSDIIEYMKLGDGIPSSDELLELANEAQKQALEYKQSGNIDMAKVSLVESKKYKVQAERLERILRKGSSDHDSTISESDLEGLLNGTKGKSAKNPPTPAKVPTNPWLEKPSGEIKLEVLRLKNENQVKQATELLKVYKLVLKKETDKADADRCNKIIERLQGEIEVCDQQILRFSFFRRFCETYENYESIGTQQVTSWRNYLAQSQQAIRLLKAKGSKALQISQQQEQSRLFHIVDDDLIRLVESGTKPNEGSISKLEVSIVEVLDVNDNKTLTRVLHKQPNKQGGRPHLKVEVKFHLPDLSSVSKEEPATSNPTLTFSPLPSNSEGSSYYFSGSKYITLPQKDTKQAKTILRRMETKKVQVNVYYDPFHKEEKNKTKSSWFSWGSAANAPESATADDEKEGLVFLGKVVMELKGLLSRNCFAGDFPLQVNSRNVGGIVRLCIRTNEPLDPTKFEGETAGKVTINRYDRHLSFSPSSGDDGQVAGTEK